MRKDALVSSVPDCKLEISSAVCQCRLKTPQMCRSKIPHFVAGSLWLQQGAATVLGAVKGRALARPPHSGFIP
jgi:hypothetical protein